MAIDTYVELTTAIADYLHRSDMTATIPTFIGLAEARLNRELRVAMMEERATASADGDYLELPSDFQSVRQLTTNGTPVAFVAPHLLDDMKGRGFVPYPPVYTIVANALRILPTPSATAALPIELTYYASLPPLATYTTNWLLTDAPDLYLKASMCEALKYLKDPQWLEWEQQTLAAIKNLRSQSSHMNFGAPVAVRAG